MNCERAEELLSDHLEGSLHEILRAELEAHLGGCAACRELRSALDDVVGALRAFPDLDAPAGLAERAAAIARRSPVVVRPAVVLPHWAQVAAAGFALIALGTLLMLVGPEKPTRAAQRIVGQTMNAGTSLMDHKDRLVEDVRLLGVVVGTAFEGRLDRVNERVEDYRRMLERRRAEPADSKSGALALPGRVASGSRTGPRGGA